MFDEPPRNKPTLQAQVANDSGFGSVVASVAPQGVLRKGLFDLLKAGG